ncbi:uncharacterized protein EV420DRAFT_1074983 [Desarmillaria tabescens]|uniref:Hydrophobin n=1 Tax=Armillaria tabescens TaxID=1929756 RepID=A0AA39JH83_ARMTA|nr:uncharacterized protein EV420DRAFT_1074983 [Desarmillaria tabescens]KAK0442731.1 hypothetical protein EV420DRAFT_1074983 [Desarmillaria tabescens]
MVKILRSLLILATAALAVAETPTQRCSGYNQLVQCCENVVITNKAPLAALNVDAGPLDPSKYVGLGCSLPRIVIAQSAVSWYVFHLLQLRSSTEHVNVVQAPVPRNCAAVLTSLLRTMERSPQ